MSSNYFLKPAKVGLFPGSIRKLVLSLRGQEDKLPTVRPTNIQGGMDSSVLRSS